MDFEMASYSALLVACLMEAFKKAYVKALKSKQKGKIVNVPSWIALLAGALFSAVVAYILWAWKMQDENMWAIAWYALAIFAFQYLVSMEFIKRILKALAPKTGIKEDIWVS